MKIQNRNFIPILKKYLHSKKYVIDKVVEKIKSAVNITISYDHMMAWKESKYRYQVLRQGH